MFLMQKKIRKQGRQTENKEKLVRGSENSPLWREFWDMRVFKTFLHVLIIESGVSLVRKDKLRSRCVLDGRLCGLNIRIASGNKPNSWGAADVYLDNRLDWKWNIECVYKKGRSGSGQSVCIAPIPCESNLKALSTESKQDSTQHPNQIQPHYSPSVKKVAKKTCFVVAESWNRLSHIFSGGEQVDAHKASTASPVGPVCLTRMAVIYGGWCVAAVLRFLRARQKPGLRLWLTWTPFTWFCE